MARYIIARDEASPSNATLFLVIDTAVGQYQDGKIIARVPGVTEGHQVLAALNPEP